MKCLEQRIRANVRTPYQTTKNVYYVWCFEVTRDVIIDKRRTDGNQLDKFWASEKEIYYNICKMYVHIDM